MELKEFWIIVFINDYGNYAVDFDASRFSSGVYFYTLKAGEFIQSKKMIFMK